MATMWEDDSTHFYTFYKQHGLLVTVFESREMSKWYIWLESIFYLWVKRASCPLEPWPIQSQLEAGSLMMLSPHGYQMGGGTRMLCSVKFPSGYCIRQVFCSHILFTFERLLTSSLHHFVTCQGNFAVLAGKDGFVLVHVWANRNLKSGWKRG